MEFFALDKDVLEAESIWTMAADLQMRRLQIAAVFS